MLRAGVTESARIQRDDPSVVVASQYVVEECFNRPIGHREHRPAQGMLLLGLPKPIAVVIMQLVDIAMKRDEATGVLKTVSKLLGSINHARQPHVRFHRHASSLR